ncbi:DUF1223 domain-containing protein [Mucilaginibacter sp.]
MRALKLLLLAGSLLTIVAATAQIWPDKKAASATAAPGFAVVELFTSEGCSSCPPADALVEKIQKEAAGQQVYILAYHVDYWNRLGWKDPFSSHAYSARQYQYSNWLKLNGVYTPQIVVNGQKEFIGSQEGTLRNAIKSGLQSNTDSKLQLTGFAVTGTRITVRYQAADATNVLVLAAVQKQATIKVKAGENDGRTLSHVQIVQALKQFNTNGQNSGTVTLDLPSNADTQNLELVGFLQNSQNGQITAATRITATANRVAAVNIH